MKRTLYLIVIILLVLANILLVAGEKVDLQTVVDSNNKFGFELYEKFNEKEGNQFFSPYSITSALLMTYEGAKGKTAKEMRAVMHLTGSKQDIRSDFREIMQGINKEDKSYKLTTANALWMQTGYPFVEEYFEIVKKYYDGKLTNLDFQKHTEKSRVTINDWIEEKTEDRIKNLIPKGLLDPMTVSVLTNAIYFKAQWLEKFNKEYTRKEEFTLSSDNKVKASMMHNTDYYGYAETENVQVLEMDYIGNEISMLVLLPKANDIEKVEDILNSVKLNDWRDSLKSTRVNVSLPRFKFEAKYLLARNLSNMGMSSAFQYPQADFTGISPTGELFISEVVHQAFVEVAEYGTEAAAATAVVMKAGAAPQMEKPKTFKADHPFMFIIQQKDTGNILFMGKLCDPN